VSVVAFGGGGGEEVGISRAHFGGATASVSFGSGVGGAGVALARGFARAVVGCGVVSVGCGVGGGSFEGGKFEACDWDPFV
jgi:hypothetical protein